MNSAVRSLAAMRVIAAIAVVAVTSAGCSHSRADVGASAATGSGSSASASASRAAPGTSSAADTTSSTREQAVKFAECMRSNGVGAFPDPDASGALTLDGVVNGTGVDPGSAGWKRAIAACQHLQPPGFTGTGRSPQQQQAALKFAQCVRDHGVKDFPDPAKSEPLVNTNLIPSTASAAGLSILNAAMRGCSDFAAAAGVKAGR